MKKIKETLYEKFQEESDPIEDMNIGFARQRKEIQKILDRLADMYDEAYETEALGNRHVERRDTMDVIDEISDMLRNLSFMKK